MSIRDSNHSFAVGITNAAAVFCTFSRSTSRYCPQQGHRVIGQGCGILYSCTPVATCPRFSFKRIQRWISPFCSMEINAIPALQRLLSTESCDLFPPLDKGLKSFFVPPSCRRPDTPCFRDQAYLFLPGEQYSFRSRPAAKVSNRNLKHKHNLKETLAQRIRRRHRGYGNVLSAVFCLLAGLRSCRLLPLLDPSRPCSRPRRDRGQQSF